MTAKRIEDDEWDDDLPVPPWVRPLSLDEQKALIREADDSIARGEIYDEAESNRRLDEIEAGTYLG